MPGPVSQSYDPCPFDAEGWRRKLAKAGNRYFVLKIDDVFEHLGEDLDVFDSLLATIEEGRQKQGKTPALSYRVYARHWPKADEVQAKMEECLGHPIGEPYKLPEDDEGEEPTR